MTSQTAICRVNGYHYTTDLASDVDDSESWEIEMGEVEGLYRGDVYIDGCRCVLFTNKDTGARYAALPHAVEIGA